MKRTLLITLSVLLAGSTYAQPWAQLVKDACPNDDFLQAGHYAFNNKIYYLAGHPDYGVELWVSDGTGAGTHMLKDIYPGPDESSDPFNFMQAGGKLFFTATDDKMQPRKLYVTDGTETGTHSVKDVFPNDVLYPIGNRVVFAANNSTPGTDLWASDGTATGTTVILPVYPGYIESTVQLGNDLFLYMRDPLGYARMYKTDGTSVGTSRIGTDSTIVMMTAYNNKILYTNYDADNTTIDFRMCDADGQNISTIGSYSNVACGPFVCNNKIYFVVYDDTRKSADLYVSNGTNSGTVKIKQLATNSVVTYQMVAMNNKLAIFCNNGIWISDGTNAGTNLIATMYPENPMAHNNKAYFLNRGNLWVTDGTSVGTRVLDTDLYVVTNMLSNAPLVFIKANDKLYFEAREYVFRNGKRYSSGRSALRFVNANDEVHTVYPAITTMDTYFGEAMIGSDLYLSANDSISGVELWKITDFPTGVAELGNKTQQQNIYPNPANNTFSIKTDNTNNTTVKVFSLTGQLLLQTMQTQNISIAQLPAGIYMVQINADGKMHTEKLVKE